MFMSNFASILYEFKVQVNEQADKYFRQGLLAVGQ